MKKLYGAMMVIAGILIFGTAGASDQNLISLGQGIAQVVVAVVVGSVGYIGLKKED